MIWIFGRLRAEGDKVDCSITPPVYQPLCPTTCLTCKAHPGKAEWCLRRAGGSWQHTSWSPEGKKEREARKQHILIRQVASARLERVEAPGFLERFNDSLNPSNNILKNELVDVFKQGFNLACRGSTRGQSDGGSGQEKMGYLPSVGVVMLQMLL